VVAVCLERSNRSAAVDAPRFLPLIHEFFDLFHHPFLARSLANPLLSTRRSPYRNLRLFFFARSSAAAPDWTPEGKFWGR
jgi:hypothetical protein